MSPQRAAARLEGQQVHLWRWVPDPLATEGEPSAAALSADERRRADAFSAALDRRRYIAAHGFMRHVLAHYVDVAANELQFDTAEDGKPSLNAAHGGGITFNLSHSRDQVLLGVARHVVLGVDIEVLRPVDDLDALVKSTLGERERGQFDRLESGLRHEAFFAAWTRKEALVKATGAGLSSAFARLEVSIDPRLPAALLAVDGSASEAQRWSLWSARTASAWCALAAPQPGLAVQLFSLAAG